MRPTRTVATDEAVTETVLALCEKVGKVAVLAGFAGALVPGRLQRAALRANCAFAANASGVEVGGQARVGDRVDPLREGRVAGAA